MYKLTCVVCGNEFEVNKVYRNGRTTCSTVCRTALRKKTNAIKYGVENVSRCVDIKEKKKSTFRQNYGTSHYFQTAEFKEKIKDRMLNKFGVEHNSQSEIIKSKKKETMLERYGVENPSLVPEFQAKKVKTSIINYGVSHPSQSSTFKEKVKSTNITKYGTFHRLQQHIPPESFNKLNDIEWLVEQNRTKSSVQIGKEIGVSYGVVLSFFRRHNIQYTRHHYSIFENEIAEYICELSENVIRNDRSLIGKELDIFVPSRNLAIECNGSYWHAEIAGNKDSKYHITKTRSCNEKGIELLHIWEHEWRFKKEIVKSMILSKLNKVDKIYARNCSLTVLGYDQEKEFLNNNHIQGYTPSSVCYGLCFDHKLVSVMSFGKNRFKKGSFELLRFCNKLGTSVVGGPSKLFKAYITSSFVDTIVSYSHKDKFTGSMYKRLGFKFSHSSNPSYYYTQDYTKFENRIKYQKHKLPALLEDFDPDLTEWGNMQANGFDRIWDCGNDVWVWSRSDK